MEHTGEFDERHEVLLLEDFRNIFSDSPSKERIFTGKELQEYSQKSNEGSLAGRYLVKELIFKYLDISGDYREIEILNDPLGKPVLKLTGKIRQLCKKKNIRSICCSISHSRERAAGMIVVDLS